jgi:hypothetical protein
VHDYYDKMREDLDRHDQSRVRGLSTRDVVAQSYTESELRGLVASLRERPSSEATFRLSSFISEQRQDLIPDELRRSAADFLADYVTSGEEQLGCSAVKVFIVWGAHRTDHSPFCMSLLRHPNAGIRSTALSHAGAFVQPRDFPVLLEFQNDPDVSEVAMGGPLRYILRDHALQLLEWLTRCPIAAASDCFEDTPNGRVSYRSWSPFLTWYETTKNRSWQSL